MQQKFSIFLTIALCYIMLFASCSKENNLEPEQPPVDIPPVDIPLVKDETANVTAFTVTEIASELNLGNTASYKWEMVETPTDLYVLQGTDQKKVSFLTYTAGAFKLKLTAAEGDKTYTRNYTVTVTASSSQATAYIVKIHDFMPAVGQFTNQLPKYEEGDTQETMNQKVLAAIGNNKKGMISLGGFGGYVVAGFDHTILNVQGKRDFRVLGNAYYSAANPSSNAPEGGSCEPGVIMVAYDANKNGVPDEDEWYEIAGSSHEDPAQELWYQKAKDAGNDVKTYFNYEITYHRPGREPATPEEKLQYIRWEDNQGHSGYKVKNAFHNQPYFPLWAKGDKLTFKGTCLPQNGVDESGQGNYYVLYKFRYGYADNEVNTKDEAAIDIDWAVNSQGEKVHLPGVDFIKIYTGVNQESGWLGECSTEITGIEDLHLLGVSIDTRK